MKEENKIKSTVNNLDITTVGFYECDKKLGMMVFKLVLEITVPVIRQVCVQTLVGLGLGQR